MLASEITTQATRIHELAVEAADAEASVLAIRSDLKSDSQAIISARRAIRQRTDALRTDAINSFVDQGSADGMSVAIGSSQTNVVLRQEYLNVATGDISRAAGLLTSSEKLLAARTSSLDAALRLAEGKVAEADAARQELESEVAQEVATLSSVKGRLAELVAHASDRRHRAQGLPAPADVAAVANGPAATTTWGGATPAAFAALRQCESGDNYADDTGNGYYGAYQFSLATWEGLGYSGLPSQAPPAMQDQAAERLEAADGWGQWPACAAELGLT